MGPPIRSPAPRRKSGVGAITSPRRGFHNSLLLALGLTNVTTGGNVDTGVIANLATFNTTTGIVNTPIPHVKIASITDGTSNTIMLGEDTARPVGYNHARQIYNQHGGPVDGVLNPTDYGGGAWADPYTFAHLCGSTADGIRCNGGLCMINCSSNNESTPFIPAGLTWGSPMARCTF